MNYFSVFGLPRKLEVDLEGLERRFHDLSRKVHPDFFRFASPAEQAKSLEQSALVNRAYRTLRDPISRVEYLIRLEEGAATDIPARAPTDLLEEIVEVQEVLEGAKAAGVDLETRRRLEDVRERLRERRDAEEAKLGEVRREWDSLVDGSGGVPPDRDDVRVKLLDRMKEILAARAYLSTVVNHLNAAIGEEAATDVSHRRH